MDTLKRIGVILLTVIVVAAGIAFFVDRPVQQGITNFDSITLSDDLIVGGDLTVTGDITPPLDISMPATLDVPGAATITGTLTTITNTVVGDALSVTGLASLDGGIAVDTTAFTVADTSGNTSIAGTLNVTGNVSDSNSAVTVTDNVLVDGAADAHQLTVQGYVTQTNNLLVLENSGGTDVLTVGGTGTTDIAGTLNYGANNLYPLGFASSGQQVVYGTSTITGTATAAHGLTTVTFAMCSLGSVQDANTASCSVAVAANAVTLYTYEDDGTTQSTEASVPVMWMVVGAP